jgi:hypothetical protein
MTFTNAIDLQINAQKNGFVPIAIPPQHIPTVTSLIGYRTLQLPIKYLGLPLTHRKPTIALFTPLVEPVQRRIDKLNGPTLSISGRMIMLDSILNALPIYYMRVFLLPQGTIDRIITYTCQFLWRENKSFSDGHCLVTWQALTLPKKRGGIGILDLKAQNDVLLLRWLWTIHTYHNSPWATKLRTQLNIRSVSDLRSDAARSSPFLRDLYSLLPLFLSCTQPGVSGQAGLWLLTNDRHYSTKSAYDRLTNPGV